MNAKLLVEKLIDCFQLLDNIDEKINRMERRHNDYHSDLRTLSRAVDLLQERVRALEHKK